MSIRPGGSVFLEHRNLEGEGRQLYGSVSTGNFLAPQDDLGFKVEYVRPYLWGDKDPKRTALNVSAFNSRKLSPVFTGGPFSDEVKTRVPASNLPLSPPQRTTLCVLASKPEFFSDVLTSKSVGPTVCRPQHLLKRRVCRCGWSGIATVVWGKRLKTRCEAWGAAHTIA